MKLTKDRKCTCCHIKFPEGTTGLIDSSGFVCYACFSVVVSELTIEQFDKMDMVDYEDFSNEVMNPDCPHPTRKALFEKILKSKRMQDYINRRGIKMQFDGDKINVLKFDHNDSL